jgi:hypothetical protein
MRACSTFHYSAVTKIALIVMLAATAVAVASPRQREKKALGEARPLDFGSSGTSESELQHFLDGDFTIIKDMRALPSPVVAAFTEKGGSRLVIANPGEKFIAGDVIFDSSVPRKRLIFAGVLGQKSFVYYEQGGIAHGYLLALFEVSSSGVLKPLWRGTCSAVVRNISELRSQLKRRIGRRSGSSPDLSDYR